MRKSTADVPHQSADAHLPEATAVLDAATALDTALDMIDPQLTLVELLVHHVLLPRALLPQIEINSCPGTLLLCSSVGSCTGSLRIIAPPRKPGRMSPYHPMVRGHCHDSRPLLLSARGVGTPVAVCHAARCLAQPMRS